MLKRINDEEIPTVYAIQRSWTGLSWETCERLHTYIQKICERRTQAQLEDDQEKVTELLEEIEFLSPTLSAGADFFAEGAAHEMKQDYTYYPIIKLTDWQALKKKYLGGGQ